VDLVAGSGAEFEDFAVGGADEGGDRCVVFVGDEAGRYARGLVWS
jgi:hypothetical protein